MIQYEWIEEVFQQIATAHKNLRGRARLSALSFISNINAQIAFWFRGYHSLDDDIVNEIQKHIGSLIEVPIFYEHLSAHENLEIHLAYMGCSGDIDGTLDMVGLKPASKQPVSKFSLGSMYV